MAPLIRSANISAPLESIVPKKIASRFPAGVCANFRVCTIEECR